MSVLVFPLNYLTFWPQNLFLMIGKTIQMFGLYIFSLDAKYREEFESVLPKMFKSGQLKYTEDITKGLEHAGEAILAQQEGRNSGKSVVIVAEE